MAFWASHESEAKRNYRFKVTLVAFGANSTVWWAKTATLPSFDVSEVEHNHMDNKYYFPGRVSWSEVSLSLVDPISPDATDLLNKMLVDSGYIVPANEGAAANKSSISKKKAAGLGLIKIEVLDAEGKEIEIWELKNPFIKSANFGSLDYSSDDLKTIEMTLRYDWATCTGGAGADTRFEAKS